MEACFWDPQDAQAKASCHGALGIAGKAIIVRAAIKAAHPFQTDSVEARCKTLSCRSSVKTELVCAWKGLLDAMRALGPFRAESAAEGCVAKFCNCIAFYPLSDWRLLRVTRFLGEAVCWGDK